jgi:UDP-N-acetyl-D-mannosaminuronate dehydrogenase
MPSDTIESAAPAPAGRIAIVGLGYVGLPLATEFGRQREVLGFDVNPVRIAELREGHDRTREVEPEDLAAASGLRFSSDPQDLASCRIFIVTVPTPIDAAKRPDIAMLLAASQTVGRALKQGDIVIYESTVYPGATEEDCVPVLEAAGTKWNFLPFRPGLVGGHCIGVDPYYLTHKAQELGYDPQVVLAGRRINDAMGSEVAMRLVRAMIRQGATIKGSRVLILGLTFKENCPDLRNTRVVDIVAELASLGVQVDVHDPLADPHEAVEEYGLELREPQPAAYDGIVVAVGHDEYREWGAEKVRALGSADAAVFDLKGIFPPTPGVLRL